MTGTSLLGTEMSKEVLRLQGELNHSVTIVPVSPICLQRSSKRFSAARLISSECSKRAKASSYVTFFVSMVLVLLTFHAAKVRTFSDISKFFKRKFSAISLEVAGIFVTLPRR